MIKISRIAKVLRVPRRKSTKWSRQANELTQFWLGAVLQTFITNTLKSQHLNKTTSKKNTVNISVYYIWFSSPSRQHYPRNQHSYDIRDYICMPLLSNNTCTLCINAINADKYYIHVKHVVLNSFPNIEMQTSFCFRDQLVCWWSTCADAQLKSRIKTCAKQHK